MEGPRDPGGAGGGALTTAPTNQERARVAGTGTDSGTGTVGRGWGKAILVGEHAVVHGFPALALPLDRGVTVRLEDAGAAPSPPELPPPVPEALAAMAAELEADPAALRVGVESDLPAGAGLGASAALSVAFARALLARRGRPDASDDDVVALAQVGEAVFHGRPSGIDATVAASGSAIRFVRGDPPKVRRLRLPEPVPLVVARSGEPPSTLEMVDRVTRRLEAAPGATNALFDLLATLMDVATPALERADWAALGRALDAAHSILRRLNVSTLDLDRGVAAARAASAPPTARAVSRTTPGRTRLPPPSTA